MLHNFKPPDSVNSGDTIPTLYAKQLLASKQAWEELIKAKQDFLEKGRDPRLSEAIRPQIAESWIRSRDYGVKHDKWPLCRPIEESDLELAQQQNRQLIEAAEPIMNVIDTLDIANNYVFELIDEAGVSLTRTGNLNLHQFVDARSIYEEATSGTCAHELCFRQKKPVYAIGPEHYCAAMEHLNAIAAPIFNEERKMVAALLLTQPLIEDPWLPEFIHHHTHVFGLIINLASSIECKLQLQWSQARLNDAIADAREAKARTDSMRKAKAGQRGTGQAAQHAEAGDVATMTFDDILGESTQIKRTIVLAKRFAQTDESVLLVGESGTGKEYFAQAIHSYSKRQGSFMSLNCAAIPPRLIESELFGYESGSFTGAEKGGRPGKIELAAGGTLFLDEIGDMALDLQAVLLRVLENKRVMRLGGKGYHQIDFRVIAATNQDLNEMVKNGAFREDLLFRLSVLTVSIPPLREREDDALMFANYYLEECLRKNKSGPTGFDDKVLALLRRHRFPGNVRQLKNAITAAFYSATGDTICFEDLPDQIRSTDSAVAGLHGLEPTRAFSLAEQEEALIRSAMAESDGKAEKAALLLGISKATIYRKLEKMDNVN